MRRKRRMRRITERILGILGSFLALGLVALGPLLVLIVILGAYYAVGPALLGPTLLGALSLFIAGFVFIAEKTGYSRNFYEASSRTTSRMLIGMIIGFGAMLSIFYVTLYIWKP